MRINIKGLKKAVVLKALYDNAIFQGFGFLHAKDSNMTIEETESLILEDGLDYDYLYGRVIKCDISEDTFEAGLYDRDNGEGAAQRAIDSIKGE